MGFVNKQAVLEHIAEATDTSVSDVEKAVNVEYWKDMVDFTSARGVELLADYLRSQGVGEVRGAAMIVIKVPLSRFQKASSESKTVSFCIDGMYASQFKRKYGSEFGFDP